MTSSSSQCAMSSPSSSASAASAACRPSSSSGGNSGTPESIRKHLTPTAPASIIRGSSPALPGTAPPQKATSTATLPSAACRFTCSARTSTVGGIEFSGMSTIVVTPPAAAARVALSNPSHSVRPGSLTCTWLSTSPGSSTSSSASVTTETAAGTSSYAVKAAIRPAETPTQTGAWRPSTTTRRARTARSRSAATVGRVAVRSQQERHVVVPVVGHREDDHDLGEEAVDVGAGVETEHVVAGPQLLAQRRDPAVGVGDAVAEVLAGPGLQAYADPPRRLAGRGVEDVGRE